MSTKRDENGMTKEEITAAVQEHGGDPTMTLGDALGALVNAGKVKVAKENGSKNKGNKVAAVVPAPKFSFKKPATLPTIHRILTAEERQKALEAERVRKGEEETALSEFKTQIGPWMPDLVASFRAFAAMTEEERDLLANKEAEEQNRQALADIFNQVSGKARDVAVKCFAAAYVLTCPKRRRDVDDVMDKLTNYDLITKSKDQGFDRIPKDGIRAYDTNYQLTNTFQNDLEALEIMRDLRNLVRETRNAGREFFQTLEKAFEQKNDNPMTVDNLVALIFNEPAEKKEGTIIQDIPEEKGRDREGNPFIHKSGRMLFGISDNKLFVIDGLGGTQKVALKLAEMGTFLFLNQLREERVRFTENMGDMARKSVALLHKLARIGIRTMREKAEKVTAEMAAAEAKAKMEAAAIEAKAAEDAIYAKEREGLLAEVAKETLVISLEEFFLQGKPGAVSLEYLASPWVRKDKGGTDEKGNGTIKVTEFPYPGNAVAIRQDDGKIRVKCPSRLATLYQGNQEASFPTDSRFEGLEYPIWKMLQIGFGIAQREKDEADRRAKEEAKAAMAETPTETTGIEAQ